MSQRMFQVNLTNTAFPHSFAELGATVVLADQAENNRLVSAGFSGEGADNSAGIAQAYFMQNVLPLARGFTTTTFRQVLQSIPAQVGVADQFSLLRGPQDAVAILVAGPATQYIFDPTVGSWQEFLIPAISSAPPTVAYIKQRTFVYYPQIGCYEYNFQDRTFQQVELVGLASGRILGICAAGSQLVAYTAGTVLWSSNQDPTDFTPSLATGAGSTQVLAVKGGILACLSIGQDFVIYTTTNSVGARQSGDTSFPFVFQEIQGSKGISSLEHVAHDTNRGLHITWTASGFQSVSLDGADYIWPDLSDGVIRGILSEWDEVQQQPVLSSYDSIGVRLNFVGNRYIAVSLRNGAETGVGFPFALLYDTALNRWGRIDARHRDFVEFVAPDISRSYTYADVAEMYPQYSDMLFVPYSEFAATISNTAPQPAYNFGVCLSNGSIYRMAPWQAQEQYPSDPGILATQPRLVLGKFKVSRSRGALLHSVRAQGLDASANVGALLHDYTGNLVGRKGGFISNPRSPGEFTGRANADSFSLVLAGDFVLNSLVLAAADGGRNYQRVADPLSSALYVVVDDPEQEGELLQVADSEGRLVVVLPPGLPTSVGSTAYTGLLYALYQQGMALDPQNYTPESWAPVAVELAIAQQLLEDAGSSQASVDATAAALEAALAGLESSIPLGPLEP